MSKLLIFLPLTLPRATLVYDYALAPDGRTLLDHASAPLALLPAAQRSGEVVAVVPAALLSWHSVELPKGVGAGSRRLRPILEGLLEDRLLDESVDLHLAVAPDALAGGQVWVAVCDKAWLRAHLLLLETSQRAVTRIVPEFAPQKGPVQLYAVGDVEQPQMVATGADVGGVLRVPLTAAALALLPAACTVEDRDVLVEPDLAALAGRLLKCKVSLLPRHQRWSDASRTTWDLAQFDFVSSGRARTVKRLLGGIRDLLHAPGWQPARWGVVLFLVLNLTGLNTWAIKEQSALRARRSAVQDLLTQTFPHIKIVIDAPLQMERAVGVMRQAAGAASDRDLEAILAALGAAMPVNQVVSHIEFVVGEARVKGLQLSGQEASSLSAQLGSLGYSVRQQDDVLLIKHETRQALVL